MFKFNVSLATFACVLYSLNAAAAATLITSEDATVTSVVTDLTGFQTTGADMAGNLQVTAFFAGGTSETVNWVATGVNSGNAIGAGSLWTLDESGDTFNASGPIGRWSLQVKSPNILIDRLRLVGVSPLSSTGGTVFDRTFGNAFGTDGSFLGSDFGLEAAVGPWDLKVTYVDLVDSLADGAGAVRDIWGQLDIDFIGGATGPAHFTVDNRLFFHQDTDIVGARMPCPPGYSTTAEGACVPEPSTLVYGVALIGFGIARLIQRRIRA